MIKATLWDFGGVISTSPFDAFNRFERDNNIPENFIRTVNATNPDTNAWARLEKSEITVEEFDKEFEKETRNAGYAVKGRSVLDLLAGDLRPEMIHALRKCNDHFLTACLTNNILSQKDSDMQFKGKRMEQVREIMDMFDVVVESSKIGVRKPDSRFYKMACDMLKIEPHQAVYLDDLGINLKPARSMGMQTIKVIAPNQALKELEAIVGISLIQ
jgi:putative hydrolase of the HAD superfamily